MRTDNNQQAFFALLRAGLWEKDVQLAPFREIDFAQLQRLAEEQSVVGLVAAGLEHVVDAKIPKKDVLQIIAQTLQLERKNQAMNFFIGDLVEKMREEGINTLLVKGQGIAQCYERPLWRFCGDVDLFLSESNYEHAKRFLSPLASSVKIEGKYKQEYSLTIESWVVELHGNMRCGLSSRMDRTLDDIQKNVFYGGDVRPWMNGKTQVFIPGINCDIFFVFTHFLKHFYCGGIGLRQICDWCRLLSTSQDRIQIDVLKKRLSAMGLISEWKAFGVFAVKYLGMPIDVMPLYSPEKKWERKADKICSFILMVGNFGCNRDMNYFGKYPYLTRKLISFGRRIGDLARHAMIFPLDSMRFALKIMYNGVISAIRGE